MNTEIVLCVTVRAPVVSFRRPLDHNYQRTLPMPPPTTILGIAGAALGLSDKELWAPSSPLRATRVAVWMEARPGHARDMWTVLKIKSGKIAERSPYFRELLFFTSYTLIYGDNRNVLENLREAFLNPTYPLSLGREDELVAVEEAGFYDVIETNPRFSATILPVDIRHRKIHLPLREGIRYEPAVVETLPVRFSVDARGVRHPEDPRPFSFLPLELEIEVPGVRALRCRERNFTWLNS